MTKLSERLQQLRESEGWSKTAVAQKLGLNTLATYANYEYGTRQPDNDTLIALAKLYDVSTDYLLGKSDSKSDNRKSATDVADMTNVLTFEGREIPEEDRELINRLLRGGRQ